MKIEVYAVFDSAVSAFNRPLFFRSRGEALRSFEVAVKEPGNGFIDFPAHYSFFQVGTFDEGSGLLEAIVPADRVCSASDFVVPKA